MIRQDAVDDLDEVRSVESSERRAVVVVRREVRPDRHAWVQGDVGG